MMTGKIQVARDWGKAGLYEVPLYYVVQSSPHSTDLIGCSGLYVQEQAATETKLLRINART
jgi:hypothetical protein